MKILEVEYQPGEELVIKLKSPKFENLSSETITHLKTVKKELLKSLRSAIDIALESIEKAEKKRTKIEVE